MNNLENFKSKENVSEICFQVLNDFISIIRKEVVVGTYVDITTEKIKKNMLEDFKYTLEEFTNALKYVFETHRINENIDNCDNTEFCVFDEFEKLYDRYSLKHDKGTETVRITLVGTSTKTEIDSFKELFKNINSEGNFLIVENILNQISAESLLKVKTLEQ